MLPRARSGLPSSYYFKLAFLVVCVWSRSEFYLTVHEECGVNVCVTLRDEEKEGEILNILIKDCERKAHRLWMLPPRERWWRKSSQKTWNVKLETSGIMKYCASRALYFCWAATNSEELISSHSYPLSPFFVSFFLFFVFLHSSHPLLKLHLSVEKWTRVPDCDQILTQQNQR